MFTRCALRCVCVWQCAYLPVCVYLHAWKVRARNSWKHTWRNWWRSVKSTSLTHKHTHTHKHIHTSAYTHMRTHAHTHYTHTCTMTYHFRLVTVCPSRARQLGTLCWWRASMRPSPKQPQLCLTPWTQRCTSSSECVCTRLFTRTMVCTHVEQYFLSNSQSNCQMLWTQRCTSLSECVCVRARLYTRTMVCTHVKQFFCQIASRFVRCSELRDAHL